MAELKYNYLIVVATETERACVIDKVRELGNTITPYRGGGRAYFDLGFIYGQRVALVQVAMGAATVGGSISTTLLMLPYLKPQFLVMVGIAFGVDETKQTLGTVLISRKILGYEQQRIGTTEDGNERRIVQRGSITDASPELVSLLEAATAVWSEAPVQTGLMLSGEKLVDNIDYREDLKSIANGEAIGGEMEGVGFVVATAEKPTPWVIVKAICDWADGNKSQQKKERQLIAAKNAVSLVFRALQIVPDREVS
jgi:nucleoside phosphorylase